MKRIRNFRAITFVQGAMLSIALIPMLALASPKDAFDPGPNPLLMRQPTINKTHIVFSFAGDLWTVARSGGSAVRLTSGVGNETNPVFSPDGSTIAFSGLYDGNRDVFTIPAKGGVPKRLTYHPANDTPLSWTPDGKSVVMTSSMISNTGSPRLFTVGAGGGTPKALPFPAGTQASFSPDGSRLAYVPGWKWQEAWKRYRGGQAYPIWIGQMSDSKVKEIPRGPENNEQPMWVGDKVFYISDKRGPVGLFSYDVGSGKVTEEIKGEGFDIKSASAGPGAIVYEKLGSLWLYNLESKKTERVDIDIKGDFAEVRPQFKDFSNFVSNTSLSPTGQRVVVEARGRLFTVPAQKGDIRDLTDQQGIAERDPAWSPDGKTIAFISDESGSYKLVLKDYATGAERSLGLGDPPAFYSNVTWSPDSKKIAYTDNKKAIWFIDVSTGKNTRLDNGLYEDPRTSIIPRWSPDSNWLTWSRDLDSHLNAVFVYSLESGKTTQVTDGMSNAKFPIFDRDGRHLYFVASTNTAWAASYLDISSLNNANVVSSVYAIVLRADGADPLQPESDEEGAGGSRQAPEKFRIDLEDIQQRTIALPIPARTYNGLEPGSPGTFFLMGLSPVPTALTPPQSTIYRFSFADRRSVTWVAGGQGISTNAAGDKALLFAGGGISIVPTAAPPQPGQGALDLSNMQVKLDPRAEWRQMFREIWRNEAIYFYAPNLHGIDVKEMERRYEPFVANVCSRSDLNYLFIDMLGELCIGHMFINGGDLPLASGVPGGLLGADYAFENGRYRLTTVYTGESWNPNLRAPLTQPGVRAKVGEYILAIDGQELTDENDIYQKLEGKAGKQVRVKIGPTPNGVGAREVIVVPVSNEAALRNIAWREGNRRYVEKATNGRVGYVHFPDTNAGGWEAFNRYYYAQVGKEAVVIDERFNNGGLIMDFVVHEMTRKMNAMFAPRSGKDWPTPGAAIFGPKVMITNQYAGSGGDMFPWLFRHNKVGKIVGTRTWGGLVRSFGFQLVDGGIIRSPDTAFYNPEGKWEIENYGVDPDIEVDLDPYLWRQGRDPQLERAVDEIEIALKNYVAPKINKPAFPDKSKVGPGLTGG